MHNACLQFKRYGRSKSQITLRYEAQDFSVVSLCSVVTPISIKFPPESNFIFRPLKFLLVVFRLH